MANEKTQARAGLGVQLFIMKDAENKIRVAELTSVSGIAPKADTIDVSNHDTKGGYKEFITSLKDGGELSVEGNFVGNDDGQKLLYDAFENNEILPVQIEFPVKGNETKGAYWEADVLVTSPVPVADATIDAALKFKATLKISGKPTFHMPEVPAV